MRDMQIQGLKKSLFSTCNPFGFSRKTALIGHVRKLGRAGIPDLPIDAALHISVLRRTDVRIVSMADARNGRRTGQIRGNRGVFPL